MTATTRANKYGAKCARCDQWVAPETGLLSGSRGAWTTVHAGECPAPKALPAQPALGYYVRKDGAAIKVVEGRKNADGTRRRYGKVLTPRPGRRPTWAYVPGAGYSVADLRPMDAADAAGIGLALGHCIECCAPLGGETLAAQCSAIVGYGATCAANNGWPFPKGVAAQRALVARKGEGQYREPTRREALGN